MRTILVTCLILFLFIPVSTFGEIRTITHTVKQPFGGSQSPDDARIAAVAKAKREALELAGTYVESTTVVKNSQVEKDEILALTAGVLKAEVVFQKNYHADDTFGIEVTVRVEVDTALLEARLKKVLEDKPHLEQLKQARAREKFLLEKIAALEVENRKGGKSKQKTANLKKEFQNASQGITAVDWFNKALALWDDGKYTNLGQAIEYLNEAIRLKPAFAEGYYLSRGNFNIILRQYQAAIIDFDEAIRRRPNYAFAYGSRGFAYCGLVQHQRAIKDFDEAIRLKPDDSIIYGARGDAYSYLGQYQRAINDYDKAIQLSSDDATLLYYARGFAYHKLGQYQQAIEDYNEAIRLKPDNAVAYGNRGNSYVRLGKHQQAIEDYNEVIRLKPDNAIAYYYRGDVYFELGQYPLAVKDFNEAIRLKPNYADAYVGRGTDYLRQSNKKLGCLDAQKACELGDCDLLKFAKSKGVCSIETARDGRFIAYDNGTVMDTGSGLMWAAKDNGRDINWQGARSYCQNYRGGGYTDWRMPTWNELAGLYDAGKSRPAACDTSLPIHVITVLIDITCIAPWTSETSGSLAATFCFEDGGRYRTNQSDDYGGRALPVRYDK